LFTFDSFVSQRAKAQTAGATEEEAQAQAAMEGERAGEAGLLKTNPSLFFGFFSFQREKAQTAGATEEEAQAQAAIEGERAGEAEATADSRADAELAALLLEPSILALSEEQRSVLAVHGIYMDTDRYRYMYLYLYMYIYVYICMYIDR